MNDENRAEAAKHIRGATIAWGGGQYLDLENPDTIKVDLVDYAYCLAYTVRWRGQTRTPDGRRPFYGVGQHVVFGAQEMLAAGLAPEHAIAFLFHETDELPFGDMPGPAKALPEVAALCGLAKRIAASIDCHFGISFPDPDLIKRWDIRMLVTEKRDILCSDFAADQWHNGGSGGTSTVGYEPFDRRIVPFPNPEWAADEFMALCRQLGVCDSFGEIIR